MEILTGMIRSPGYIFGPAMLLSGLVALIICLQTTWSRQSFRTRTIAFWAAAFLLLGMIGAVFGGAILISQKGPIPADALASGRLALGYTILFGLSVSIVPLLWTGLLCLRRSSGTQVS